tara:strand:- start:765 stop:1577 length:813 start_codon:yes stop_codon:yes gene_type:complete
MFKRVAALFDARQLIWNFTLRELRTRYRRTLFGWLWSLATPLTSLVIYSYVFGTLLKTNAPPGDPSGITTFGLFLLSGLIPFGFFSSATGAGINALIESADLIRKVAFPRESLVLAKVLNAAVQFCIEIVLLMIVFLIAGSPLLPWIPITLLLVALFIIFTTGVSLLLSAGTIYLRDIPHFWGILIQIWFFATPIVYPPSLLDEHVQGPLKTILNLNPINHFVEAFRLTLYDGRGISLNSFLILFAISFGSLVTGWVLFGRLTHSVAEDL